jgi:UDP-N-acetylglucosamine 2-epimerase
MIQRAIDRGEIRDQAEAARKLGVTRARLTQILDLTLLAPEIQERVLESEATGGEEPASERILRTAARAAEWSKQRDLVVPSGSGS